MIFSMIILIMVFGISKAMCDLSESGFADSKLKGLNPLFWDKHKSWRNKWKGGVAANGEKFFGSSTFLVWTTDAWHLFNALSYLSLFLSGMISVLIIKNIVIVIPSKIPNITKIFLMSFLFSGFKF